MNRALEVARAALDACGEGQCEAIALAERYHRLKYAATSRLALGRALRALNRVPEAIEALRQALAEADRLRHPPTIWSAAAALADALYAAGDDAAAKRAAARAGREIETFAAGLSDARRAAFLAAPQLAEALAVAR
jgi:hypothetical protein